MDQITNSLNKSRRKVLSAIFLAYFTSYFVMSSINVALPRMAADLDGLAIYSWAIAVPALATALANLVFGKLSDSLGRRIMMLVSIGSVLVGAFLSIFSPTFILLIISLSILSLGQGSLQPLCFSALGDLFSPAERGKWAGLLNIASAVPALIIPTLSGWLVDNLDWRYVFWMDLPLAVFAGIVVLLWFPAFKQDRSAKLDLAGTAYLGVAISTLLVAVSWAGDSYSWMSFQVTGLVIVSALFLVLFIRNEKKVADPLFDLHLLSNRTFMIASMAALFSLFGITAITVYYPLFIQGVQGFRAVISGQVQTPFSVLVCLMGIPAGLLIARTKHYRWMYILGYAVLTGVTFGMVFFNKGTALGWGFLVTTVTGMSLGAIPTINALVVQYAVPKRMIGSSTGGLYFFIMFGRAIAPAILGALMNGVYSKKLGALLPSNLTQKVGLSVLSSLEDSRVLLSDRAMAELIELFQQAGDQGGVLLNGTVQAVRSALESGIHSIFQVGALTMVVSFLFILTIPEISLESEN